MYVDIARCFVLRMLGYASMKYFDKYNNYNTSLIIVTVNKHYVWLRYRKSKQADEIALCAVSHYIYTDRFGTQITNRQKFVDIYCL